MAKKEEHHTNQESIQDKIKELEKWLIVPGTMIQRVLDRDASPDGLTSSLGWCIGWGEYGGAKEFHTGENILEALQKAVKAKKKLNRQLKQQNITRINKNYVSSRFV